MMRKQCVILSILLLFSFCFSPVAAHPADGKYAVGFMEYTIVNGQATITKCDPLLQGDLHVPAELSDCPVVAIGENAFAKSQLTRVFLPESIRSIGRAAFLGASATEIRGTEHVESFGEYAFAFSALQTIFLPPSLTEIPNGLFMYAGFNDQVSFILPASVTRIGDFAFYGLNDLAEIVLPSGLREIGDAAFAGTSPKSWRNLVLPKGLVSIGDGAFWCSLSMESLTLPSTLRHCGSGKIAAFFGTYLETVSLSEGITSLPHAMFLDCHNLKSVLLPDSLSVLSDDEFGFPSLLTGHFDPFMSFPWSYYANEADDFSGGELVPHVFRDIQKNTRLFLFSEPESYGAAFAAEKAFPVSPKADYALTSKQYENDFAYRVYGGHAVVTGYTGTSEVLSVPDSLGGFPVTSVGKYALRGNTAITTVILPPSLCHLAAGAFADCSMLESVTLTGENISVGYAVFDACKKLREVIGFERVTAIGEHCFSYCDALTALPALSTSVTALPSAFASGAGLTHISLPSHIREIGHSAFSGCDALETVTLPETLETIGGSAFADCKALRTILIPDSVTALGTEAFHGCDALYYVKVGNGITSLDTSLGVFTFCPSLQTVILPDSLTEMDEYEFYDGHYARYMRRSFIERPKTLTIFANQDSYAADYANRYYIARMPLITVLYADTPIVFDALPIIREGRTLVPFRAVFEALGAAVKWDPETETVDATHGQTTLRLTIGEPTLYKNGEPIPMDVAPDIVQDRTFVPLRAVSEALDFLVSWDDSAKTAIISSENK